MSKMSDAYIDEHNKAVKETASTRMSIVAGILNNVELHRCTNSYKNATPEEKVSYYEGIISALWSATH